MIVKWIVHDRMLWGSSYTNLEQIILNCGYDCYLLKDPSLADDFDYNLPKSGPIIPYATIDVMRRLPKNYIGSFMDEHTLKYHVYTSLMDIPLTAYLNFDAVCTTYRRFKEEKEYWFQLFNVDKPYKYMKVFIRPDSGNKTFTGFVADYNSVQYDINHLNNKVEDHSLVWISSAKHFSDETRFVIVGDKVIDGSRYATQSGNTLIEDKDFPVEFWDFANKVAQAKWKPEQVFTVDICMSKFGPRIVECNSFNCCGLYACDMEKVVTAVSEHVQELYEDEQDAKYDE